MNYTIQIVILISVYLSSVWARVNIPTYKNDNLNNCDISVDLSNSGIKNLTVNFVNANCVKSLILQNNDIAELQENIFERQPYLEYLDLSRNHLKLDKFFTLGGQLSLRILILDYNNDHSYNLTTSNEIENTIGEKEKIYKRYSQLSIPHTFPELKYLSLRNIHVTGFSENWINHFPKLEHLDLSENEFTDDMLNFLLRNISSSIKNLILENVGLNMVRTDSLNNLEQLILNNNNLPRLSSHKCHGNTFCFDGMDNLRILSLSNCSVRYIEENAFKDMKNLLELELSNNEIEIIPSEVFHYLPSLKNLDLSRNPMLIMPSLENLENLTSLVMDEIKNDNLLSSLKEFPRLPQLEHLSIQGNKLAFIASSLFRSLPVLRKLNLSNNQITHLPSWDTQSSLYELNLSSNRFKSLDDLTLKNANSLKVLDLRNNSISEIKINSFRELLGKDLTLNL